MPYYPRSIEYHFILCRDRPDDSSPIKTGIPEPSFVPKCLFYIYANNEPKSALARDLGDCRDINGNLALHQFPDLLRKKFHIPDQSVKRAVLIKTDKQDPDRHCDDHSGDAAELETKIKKKQSC